MSDLRTELFTKVIPKMQELNKLNFDDPEQPEVPATKLATGAPWPKPDPEPEPVTELTNNERIFEWIKEHPAAEGTAVATAFIGKISYSSVMAQVYAMSKRGLLHKVKSSSTGNMMYSVAVDKYPRPVPTEKTARLIKGRVALGTDEIRRRMAEGHIRNQEETDKVVSPSKKKIVLRKKEPVAAPTPTVQVTPVDLNTLSIVQARKLYDELKQIFGG